MNRYDISETNLIHLPTSDNYLPCHLPYQIPFEPIIILSTGNRLTGIVYQMNKNNKFLVAEIIFVNGIAHGPYRIWRNEDGSPFIVMNCNNGMIEGKQYRFYKSGHEGLELKHEHGYVTEEREYKWGQVISESFLIINQKNKSFIRHNRNYSNGRLRTEGISFYLLKQPLERIFNDSKIRFRWNPYLKFIVRGKSKNTQRILGLSTRWDNNGVKRAESMYNHNDKPFETKKWDGSAKLIDDFKELPNPNSYFARNDMFEKFSSSYFTSKFPNGLTYKEEIKLKVDIDPKRSREFLVKRFWSNSGVLERLCLIDFFGHNYERDYEKPKTLSEVKRQTADGFNEH